MSQRPVPPRGMRDLMPAEVRRRRYLLERVVTAFEAYGFEQMEAPVLENLDRLVQSEAGDNQKLMYKVLRRGIDWESQPPSAEDDAADLGLRYDLTVPLARYFATNQPRLASPFKAIQIGSAFRAERPQKGRYRQFTQCDVDVIGDAPPTQTHAELLLATANALAACGVTGFTVRMNDRRFLDSLLDECGFASAHRAGVLVSLDKLDKIGINSVATEVRAIDDHAGARLMQNIQRLSVESNVTSVRDEFPELADSLSELAQLEDLVSKGVALRFDVSLVRGQGYYTGPIFEFEHPDGAGSIAAGGRYDRMVQKLSGIDAPAAGMSIGFERICDLLGEFEVPNAPKRVALVHDKTADAADVLACAGRLRAEGKHVRTEVATGNAGAQRKRLAELGFAIEDMNGRGQ